MFYMTLALLYWVYMQNINGFLEELFKKIKKILVAIKNYKHFKVITIITLAVILPILIVSIILLLQLINNISNPNTDQKAIIAGMKLSNNQCKGEGNTEKLSVSPMQPEDFSIIIPYGLVVGAHVTPIDHQYFSPKDYNSPINAYEVFAMADSTIVDIGTRQRQFGQEYRLVFSISCTLFYYYDLVTSLSPDIEEAYTNFKNNHRTVNIPVKAGQQIGKIGGQTLDFAVWDTIKPLTGYVIPEHYDSEAWKIYTADPLDYYTKELKEFILSRYIRTAEPISGKIDYDKDGKLIGNWFLEGTNGYGGRFEGDREYWNSHLSFAPNHIDPSWFIISIGYFKTNPSDLPGSQFVARSNTPNPVDVTLETGLVKYDLSQWAYYNQSGEIWDRNSLAKGIYIKPVSYDSRQICAIVQMVDRRKIKFEVFDNKTCSQVEGFTSNVKNYTR